MTLIGGQRREIARCCSTRPKLAAYSMSPGQVLPGAAGLQSKLASGCVCAARTASSCIETGQFLRTAEDVRNVVVGVANGRPVFLRDVAKCATGARSRRSTCSSRSSNGLSSGGHDRGLQAQRHERDRCRRRSAASRRCAEGHGDSRPTSSCRRHAATTARRPRRNRTNCCSTW